MKARMPIITVLVSLGIFIVTFFALRYLNYTTTLNMLIISVALGLVATHLIFLYAADRRREKHRGKSGNAKRIRQRDKDANIVFFILLVLVYIPIYRIYMDIGDTFIMLVGAFVIASLINAIYFMLKGRRKG